MTDESSRAQPSRVRLVERRERFAEGVASGDPAPDSVISNNGSSKAIRTSRCDLRVSS
jgi:phosphodiesterase/alkaline phosphatase D-like protein